MKVENYVLAPMVTLLEIGDNSAGVFVEHVMLVDAESILMVVRLGVSGRGEQWNKRYKLVGTK